MSSANAAGQVDGAASHAREPGAPRRPFAEVLARAGDGRAADAGAPDRAARKGCAPGMPPPAPAGKKPPLETDMRPTDSTPGDAPPALLQRARVEPPGTAELRAYVRAAAPVIAASLRPGGAELALSFGSALSLDVRSGAQGLELTLRPAPGLERVTRAELPGLVEALRAQGLRVGRAEVRPRAPATPRRAR